VVPLRGIVSRPSHVVVENQLYIVYIITHIAYLVTHQCRYSMIKSIFGSFSRERVLAFIAAREHGYALEISDFWECSAMPIKRELNNLEASGILTSKTYGKTVVYSMNPRYYLKKELTTLLLKLVDAYPPEWKEKLLNNRRRPRARGKPVNYLNNLADKDQK
jgi:hypothetical protein